MHGKYIEAVQKSKIFRLTEGDSSSKFFYLEMSMRKYKNNIKSLLNDKGELMYDAMQIQSQVTNFYIHLFNGDQNDN